MQLEKNNVAWNTTTTTCRHSKKVGKEEYQNPRKSESIFQLVSVTRKWGEKAENIIGACKGGGGETTVNFSEVIFLNS